MGDVGIAPATVSVVTGGAWTKEVGLSGRDWEEAPASPLPAPIGPPMEAVRPRLRHRAAPPTSQSGRTAWPVRAVRNDEPLSPIVSLSR